MTEKELQEKILAYRLFEARVENLIKQRDMLVNKALEVQSAVNSMDELNKSNGDIIFSIGGEAYKMAKSIDKAKVIVEIGANIALEKTVEEGKEILTKRRKELENAVNQIQHEIMKISNAMNQLAPEIQGMTRDYQHAEAG